MRLVDLLRRSKNQDLPPLAGGEPQPGDRLLAATQYMEPRDAEAALQMVEVWRQMPRAEYEAFARKL